MITYRPRRNRKSSAIRALVQETRLHVSDLICPHFVLEGTNRREGISSMPGIERLSCDLLLNEIHRICELGILALALFPVISNEKKDFLGTYALNPNGLIPSTIRSIKKEFPELCLIVDIALDPFTSHGHDGIIDEVGDVLNDPTLEILTQMALLYADAGADMVAPSDMMDGRVGAIRAVLDKNNFSKVSVHAYAVKYASSFYHPFRDALGSHPKIGNKKTYQLNPANHREALLEASLDAAEGADILMIKPALPYLDIISKVKSTTTLPVSAFQVSGEYAMIMAAAQKGWMVEEDVFWESALSIKRAGADMIFTYAAPQIAKMITSGARD